jgi:hypothetical protein
VRPRMGQSIFTKLAFKDRVPLPHTSVFSISTTASALSSVLASVVSSATETSPSAASPVVAPSPLPEASG